MRLFRQNMSLLSPKTDTFGLTVGWKDSTLFLFDLYGFKQEEEYREVQPGGQRYELHVDFQPFLWLLNFFKAAKTEMN